MQWSQIKTLFILCFLVLDVYLLIQFFDKQERNDLAVKEDKDSSVEQQLKLEDIKVPDLPDKEIKQSYISVKQQNITKSDLENVPNAHNQQVAVTDDKVIASKFKKPVKITNRDDIESEIKDNVWHADDYSYWHWDKDLNVAIFFQKKKGQPVYYNDKGLLLVYLNDDNEITAYTQTRLGKENEDFDKSKKQLIKPIRAIDTLYNRYELKTGDKITEARLGYYTSQPIASDEQTFAPTWRITVNNKRHYFVHAIEGFVFSNDDIGFLDDTVASLKTSLKSIKKEGKMEKLLKNMDKRIKKIKQEEDE